MFRRPSPASCHVPPLFPVRFSYAASNGLVSLLPPPFFLQSRMSPSCNRSFDGVLGPTLLLFRELGSLLLFSSYPFLKPPLLSKFDSFDGLRRSPPHKFCPPPHLSDRMTSRETILLCLGVPPSLLKKIELLTFFFCLVRSFPSWAQRFYPLFQFRGFPPPGTSYRYLK